MIQTIKNINFLANYIYLSIVVIWYEYEHFGLFFTLLKEIKKVWVDNCSTTLIFSNILTNWIYLLLKLCVV